MQVKRKNRTVKVKYPSGEGYNPDIVNKTALKVKDQGNGYLVEFKAFSSAYLPKMFSLDYAEAEYLYLALQEFMKEEQVEVKKKTENEWIMWSGAYQFPFDGLLKTDTVEIELRDGAINTVTAGEVRWYESGAYDDIVAYRKV